MISPAFRTMTVSPMRNIELINKILIVQRSRRDGRTGKTHRLHNGFRRQNAGPTDTTMSCTTEGFSSGGYL